jgi:hypothetical protein
MDNDSGRTVQLAGGNRREGAGARHPLDAAGELELWQDGRRQCPSAVFLLYVRPSRSVPWAGRERSTPISDAM